MTHAVRAFESHGLEQVADAVFLPWDLVAAPSIDYHAESTELLGLVYAVRLLRMDTSPRIRLLCY